MHTYYIYIYIQFFSYLGKSEKWKAIVVLNINFYTCSKSLFSVFYPIFSASSNSTAFSPFYTMISLNSSNLSPWHEVCQFSFKFVSIHVITMSWFIVSIIRQYFFFTRWITFLLRIPFFSSSFLLFFFLLLYLNFTSHSALFESRIHFIDYLLINLTNKIKWFILIRMRADQPLYVCFFSFCFFSRLYSMKKKNKTEHQFQFTQRYWVKRNLIAYDHIRILLRTESNNTLNSRQRLQNETFSISFSSISVENYRVCEWMILICACAMYAWSLTKNNEHMMLKAECLYVHQKWGEILF